MITPEINQIENRHIMEEINTKSQLYENINKMIKHLERLIKKKKATHYHFATTKKQTSQQISYTLERS